MTKKPLKRIWFYSGFSALALAPIALAASCGSDSSSDQTDETSRYNNLFASFVPSATSTHNAVVWPSVPTEATIATIQFYYSDATLTLDEIKALPTAAWKTMPPSIIGSVHNQRQLWAKITNQTVNNVTVKNVFVNITTLTQIDKVKTKIDATQAFAVLNFLDTQVYHDISNNYGVSEIIAPQGTKIVYNIEAETGIELSALQEKLKAKPSSEVLAGITAYLVNLDATKYELANNKQSNITINATANSPELSVREKDELAKIQATPESVHSAIKWVAPASISPRVASIAYLIGNYQSLASVKAAPESEWKTSLPTTKMPNTPTTLWARIDAAAGYSFDERYYGISDSSKIYNVKTLLDEDPNYAKIITSKVILVGDQTAPGINSDYVGQDETFNSDIFGLVYFAFNFLDKTNLSFEQLLNHIVARGEKLTLDEVKNIEVYLAPWDEDGYVIQNAKKAKISIVHPEQPERSFKIVPIPAAK